jgi:F0F1-type ATP synthase membrane subunit c/vacuolar-type H+-ATPase subunit K
MAISATALAILLACAGASFAIGRWASRGWRARRREKEQAARRATETRQQRRARERRQR